MTRTSHHSSMQEIEVCFNGYVLIVEAHIDFTFHPAVPAKPPSSASGGDPPEGARVEIDNLEFLVEGAPVELPPWLLSFIEDNIDDDELVEDAVRDIEAEKDEVADFKRRQMRDDKLGGAS